MKWQLIALVLILSSILSGCISLDKIVSGEIVEIIDYENERGVSKIIFKNSSFDKSILVYTEDAIKHNLQEGDDVILKVEYSGEIYQIKEVWKREVKEEG